MTLVLVCVIWFAVACIGGPLLGRLLFIASQDAGEHDREDPR